MSWPSIPRRIKTALWRLLGLPAQWLPGRAAYNTDGLYTRHNHSFMSDPGFRLAYARGVQAAGDYHWQWRVHVGLWAATVASKLPGDYVECGVNRGFMSSAIMHHLDWNALGRRFFLLDTFGGIALEELSDSELSSGIRECNIGNLESGFYSRDLEAVRRNFSEWKNVEIIVGAIPGTLASVTAARIAFLHIDLNCVQPEVAALEALWDRLSPGAIVLLDDYAFAGHEAQKLAMDAAAQKLGFAVLSLPTGQGLIVKPEA